MSFKKKINVYRKKATKSITKNLLDQQSINLSDREDIKRILITRPNHRLGNQLLISPLVKEVHRQFPGAKIDLFLKGNLGEILFKNYEYVNHIISLPKKHFKELGRYLISWFKLKRLKYDLVINAEASSSSGRLSTKVARANYKFFGYERELNLFDVANVDHISKYPIYSLRYFLKQSLTEKPLPDLEIKLTAEELNHGKKILAEYADLEKPTICLYTFATGHKCFSKAWWNQFYTALKNEYPHYNIIEALPVENVSSLDFKIPAFYSKNIRELASFISHTSVFITGDCGIMHLAAATNTPTIGLFNVTAKAMYEPYNVACSGIDTNQKSAEEICQILRTHIESLDFAESEI
ncbi:glycosyltransferase family 9 protein [Psychroflexus sp. CAK57W]|uniref:Glycosyltransferase family 9 protein n=1 Tax=Psychroflexus longus TaxID=2873596 RepID=A0ABS7XJU1_9FLAO|nr:MULTISPECIES: glycosyltransferase family 9 protein [Psychroflexus]MBZ9779247.1 glycosyltransferase family 9 protein [Psychroflexus longus]MBZ9787447.1 glycosyltransferase family 9 protein [Psychroflexus curvus]